MIATILSDSPMLPTGYSNQSKQLARYLRKKGHEVHYLANSYTGAQISYAKLKDGTEFDYNIYGEMQHSYFMNTLSEHLKKTKSDILFILLDTFMLFPKLLEIDLSPAKTFFWYPSDGGAGMPKNCELILKKVNVPVAMAKFGQKQVKDYYGIDTLHIPHGTEPNRFYKLSNEERMRLKASWGLLDKFVIGVVARNQPRKFLDRTFKIMAKLKDRVPNAVLFLHLDPNDPAQCFNMSSIIQKYGLENRVVFSGMKAHDGFDWSKMNEVYNLMDCFLLSTSGEGFGIPIIEAMSCEIPIIATNYTTTPELVLENQAGLGIKLVGTDDTNSIDFFSQHSKFYDENTAINGTIMGSWEVERGICDIRDGADKIVFLANNPQIREQMGKNGRKAVLEKYDFDNLVGPAFEKLFNG